MEAIPQLDISQGCFLDVCSAGDRSKPSNNGCNQGAVYCLCLLFGVSHRLGVGGGVFPLIPAVTHEWF